MDKNITTGLDNIKKAALAGNPAAVQVLIDLIELTAFPERDPNVPAERQGMFRKFQVSRIDGSDVYGGRHFGCRYFVLDLNCDPHAGAAMHAYGLSCSSTHPMLSQEILTKYASSANGKETTP